MACFIPRKSFVYILITIWIQLIREWRDFVRTNSLAYNKWGVLQLSREAHLFVQQSEIVLSTQLSIVRELTSPLSHTTVIIKLLMGTPKPRNLERLLEMPGHWQKNES